MYTSAVMHISLWHSLAKQNIWIATNLLGSVHYCTPICMDSLQGLPLTLLCALIFPTTCDESIDNTPFTAHIQIKCNSSGSFGESWIPRCKRATLVRNNCAKFCIRLFLKNSLLICWMRFSFTEILP